MPKTRGLVLAFSKCGSPEKVKEWNDWYDTVHLPDLIDAKLCWAASRWEVVDPNKSPFGPVLGFNHVNVVEIEDRDPEAAWGRMDALRGDWLRRGRYHQHHFVDNIITFKPTGKYTEKPEPATATKALFFVFNRTNDPSKLEEWESWLDEVHLPEVVKTGKFHAVTRWVRTKPAEFGPNHLVLFDIRDEDISAGVARVVEENKSWEKAGRIPRYHAGALMFLARPAGRWGAAGYRMGSVRPA